MQSFHQQENIRLYYFPTTRNYRVQWLLEELELKYELQIVDLKNGEQKNKAYLSIHPLAKVPALQIEQMVIIESLAICQYLSDRYPHISMSPAIDSPQRAAYYQWMALAGTTLEPAIIELKRDRIAKKKGLSTVDMGPVFTPFERIERYIEEHLKNQQFLLGEKMSSADIMVGSLLIWADEQGFLSDFQNTKHWLTRLQQRPAYQHMISRSSAD